MDPVIQFLKNRLQHPLPGDAVRMQMAPSPARAQIDDEAILVAKKAAVMILLFKKAAKWHTVFIQRSHNENDRHKGQISFPGGAYENNDANFEQTALREAEEEIGIPAKDIELLGRLSMMYIPVSGFVVHPFVGYLNYTPSYLAQESEVAEILEIPLSLLSNPSIKKKKNLTTAHGYELKNVPYFDLSGKTLWGATAMMSNEFLALFEGQKHLLED